MMRDFDLDPWYWANYLMTESEITSIIIEYLDCNKLKYPTDDKPTLVFKQGPLNSGHERLNNLNKEIRNILRKIQAIDPGYCFWPRNQEEDELYEKLKEIIYDPDFREKLRAEYKYTLETSDYVVQNEMEANEDKATNQLKEDGCKPGYYYRFDYNAKYGKGEMKAFKINDIYGIENALTQNKDDIVEIYSKMRQSKTGHEPYLEAIIKNSKKETHYLLVPQKKEAYECVVVKSALAALKRNDLNDFTSVLRPQH